MSTSETTPRLERLAPNWVGRFQAMGGPCEVLVRTENRDEAEAVVGAASSEAWRIEAKYSRYRRGNIIDRINTSEGHPVPVDEETARLLAFADALHRMSGGRFDVTSGVLRRAWKFDGSDRLPAPEVVQGLLGLVGWSRVTWDGSRIQLQPGMEIDLGGIGKEYAVDRAAALARDAAPSPALVNFGGDLAASRVLLDPEPWRVGIENPKATIRAAALVIALRSGGLTTSGDARRFLLRDGTRYGHILDPTTGWPVKDAPRSVTVVAETCTQAGMISTLAMLQGKGAESFLEREGVKNWVVR